MWLREALGRLPPDTHNEVRAIALLRLAIVEMSAKRFHDALRIHLDSAPLFIDRAPIEYAAASYHFEQAGAAARYHGCVENNLGYLFGTIGKFREAHEHLDRAQALFTGMKDIAHTAGVDETRQGAAGRRPH